MSWCDRWSLVGLAAHSIMWMCSLSALAGEVDVTLSRSEQSLLLLRGWFAEGDAPILPVEGASVYWIRSLETRSTDSEVATLLTQVFHLAYRDDRHWRLTTTPPPGDPMREGEPPELDVLCDGNLLAMYEGDRVVLSEDRSGLEYFNARCETSRQAALLDICTMLDPARCHLHRHGLTASTLSQNGNAWRAEAHGQDPSRQAEVVGTINDITNQPWVQAITFSPPAAGVKEITCKTQDSDHTMVSAPFATVVEMTMVNGDTHRLQMYRYEQLKPEAAPWAINERDILNNTVMDSRRGAFKWRSLLDLRGDQVVEYEYGDGAYTRQTIPSLREQQKIQDSEIRRAGWVILAAQLLGFLAIVSHRRWNKSGRNFGVPLRYSVK